MRKHNSPVLARPCSSTNPAPRVGMFLGALLPVGQYGLCDALLPVGNTGFLAPYCPLGNTGLVAPYCPLGNTGFVTPYCPLGNTGKECITQMNPVGVLASSPQLTP